MTTAFAGLTTLMTAGTMINNKIESLPIHNKNNKIKTEKVNTTDIYSTNNSKLVRDTFALNAKKRSNASKNFKQTKIIPRDFKRYGKNKHVDSDSEYSEDELSIDEKLDDITNDKKSNMIENMNNVTNNRRFENRILNQPSKFEERDTWVQQYAQMKLSNDKEVVSSNNTNKNDKDKNQMMARIELERQMELDGGYSTFNKNDDGTYGVVNPLSEHFVHENMSPNIRKGFNPIHENKANMVSQMKMEQFTGSANDPSWRPKTERAPLFSPLIGAKNLYGDPVRTDEYTTRFFPGNERRNELAFQQIKVTPGLDIGYNAIGKHGYHDMYRAIPVAANVDNLRTLNNPKVSYGSYTGVGQKGSYGPVMGRVAQYKTPKYKESGTKDMVGGRAYDTAPTVYGEYDPKNLATVNRGVEETVAIGHAKSTIDGNTPSKYRGNYRESLKENYEYDGPHNLVAYESMKGQGHNNESFLPDPTQREQEGQNGHIYNAQQGIKTINYDDVNDPTKRDIHNEYNRAGLSTNGNRAQYKAVNYDDVNDPTKRDIHNEYERSGLALHGNREQYKAVNYDDVSDPTKRDIHNEYNRAGLSTNGNRAQYKAVNYDDVSDPTKRDIHNEYNRAGLSLHGNREQYKAVNYDDVSDPTKRDIHNEYNRAGLSLHGNREQYKAVNYDDVSDPTKRDIHNEYNRAGLSLHGNREQYKAVNYDDVSDPTKRDIHNEYNRAGLSLHGNREQYKAVNYDDVSDPTKRDIHNEYNRAGLSLHGNREQYKAVNYDDVPDVTMREIHNDGRMGGIGNDLNGIKVINWDDVPDVTMREIHNDGRMGGGDASNREQMSRTSYLTMKMNGAKEALNEGRAPTAIGQNKSWTIDLTAFQFKNPIEGNWRSGPESNSMYKNDKLPCENTNIPVGKFYVNKRILAYTDKTLQGNPLVNNLVHKSI